MPELPPQRIPFSNLEILLLRKLVLQALQSLKHRQMIELMKTSYPFSLSLWFHFHLVLIPKGVLIKGKAEKKVKIRVRVKVEET